MIKGETVQRITIECNTPHCHTMIAVAKNTAYRAICPACSAAKDKARHARNYSATRTVKTYATQPSGGVCLICQRPFVRGLCGCKE